MNELKRKVNAGWMLMCLGVALLLCMFIPVVTWHSTYSDKTYADSAYMYLIAMSEVVTEEYLAGLIAMFCVSWFQLIVVIVTIVVGAKAAIYDASTIDGIGKRMAKLCMVVISLYLLEGMRAFGITAGNVGIEDSGTWVIAGAAVCAPFAIAYFKLRAPQTYPNTAYATEASAKNSPAVPVNFADDADTLGSGEISMMSQMPMDEHAMYVLRDGVFMQKLSAPDELLKWKEVLDQGIITQEEFDAKKKQLLDL